MSVQPRTIPGFVLPQNRGAIDWGWQGFVAYGCHALVVVSDPATVQVVQTLARHQAPVTAVRWGCENHRHDASNPYTLRLASGDASGRVVVWSAGDAKPVSEFGGDGSKPVADIEWHHADPWLLFALHSPTLLCLWNASTGARLWTKELQDPVVSFAFDPFDSAHAAILTSDAVVLFDDISVARPPSQQGRKYHVTSQASQSAQAADTAPAAPAKRSVWRQFIATDARGGGSGNAGASGGAQATSPPSQHMADCIQVVHSPSDRDVLYLVFPREVLVMDIGINQGVGSITLDRSSSPFVRLFACARRPGLIACQHENGVISVRQRRPGRDVIFDARCQSEPLRLGRGCKLSSLSMDPIDEARFAGVTTDGRLLVWDLCVDAQGDGDTEADTGASPSGQRGDGARGARPTGNRLLDTSFNEGDDGALAGDTMHVTLRAQLDSLWSPITCVAAAPASMMQGHDAHASSGAVPHVSASGRVSVEAFRNTAVPAAALLDSHRLVACGTSAGTIQVVDMTTGALVREMSVCQTAIKGIEWLDADTVLSYTVEEVGAGGFKNSLRKTDLRTGASTPVRANRGVEQGPVREVRVSHARRYFVVCPRDGPMELWDARAMAPIHDMPPFVGVTAFEWSPVAQKAKRRLSATQLQVPGEDGGAGGRDRVGSTGPAPAQAQQILKEHFVFTVTDGSLYHYTVEGALVTAGSKMQPEVGMNTISAVAWKDEMLVTGDVGGNLHLWDLKARMSKTVATGGGAVRKLRFAPGRGNYRMLVLYPDGLDLWDAERADRAAVIRAPARSGGKDAAAEYMSRPIDAEWLTTERPLVAFSDGCVRCFDSSLRRANSPVSSYLFSHAVNYALNGGDADVPVPSPHTRPHCTHPRIALHLKTLLQHQHWSPSAYRLSAAQPQASDEASNPTTPLDSEGQAEFPAAAPPSTPSSASAELGLFQAKVQHALRDIPRQLVRALEDAEDGTAQRCLAVAKHYGDELEFHFWTVALYFLRRLKGRPPASTLAARINASLPPSASHQHTMTRELSGGGDLGTDEADVGAERGARASQVQAVLPSSYDLLCDCPSVTQREVNRLAMHRSLRTSYELTQRSIERHILLGRRERAVRLLLETDPEESGFLTDGLRACLVAATISPDSFQNTMKLVGTSLIASGKVSDGVELLTLINRQHDACRYLQTYGRWNQAAWLAKSTLSDDECADVMQRWADNLSANGQKSKAALVLLSVGLFLRAANTLLANKQPDVAALLIEACIEFGVVPSDTDPKCPSDHRQCMQSVFVEYGAFLKEFGHSEASAFYVARAAQISESLSKVQAQQ